MLIEELKSLVKENADVLPYSESNTSGTEGFKRDVACIVRPITLGVIQELIKFAGSVVNTPNQFSLYPISSGKNWGYGSSMPSTVEEKVVLLDLCALNDITYFDEENGVISIQPGVTQSALFEYLSSKQTSYMVPVTGAGPTTSILSNALERGYGITPIADHFTSVMSIKGFLADGSFYQSSLQCMSDMANGDNSECYVDKTFKWKHGPYLDGIFTQSGNMIVTEITLSLARVKPAFDSFYMRFFDKESFNNAYAVVKEIFHNLEGVVGSINLMDKRRVAAMVADNPQGCGNHKVMTDEQVDAISKHYDVPEWTLVGTVYGTHSVAKAAKSDIKKIAKGKADQVLFSSDLLVRLGQVVTRRLSLPILDSAREQLEKLSAGMEVMQGKPSQVALPLAYWRNPRVRPDKSRLMNPAKDGCGLLWYAPLVPAKVSSMRAFIEMVRSITPKYNIEPMITFTNLSGISTDSTIPIVFDLENPQAVEDAHACLQALFDEGLKQGFIPYRLNIQQQLELNANSTFWKTAGKIAHALDPAGIISPDRYNPYKP